MTTIADRETQVEAEPAEAAPTMTRVELTDAVAEELRASRQAARALVETTLDLVADTLASGSNVKISGFGQFILRDKPARVGRNPKTDVIVPIAPRRVVTFRASPNLKAKVERRADPQDDGDPGAAA